eukprot:14933-Heterococcus_DN1.PRE.5
MGPYEPPNSTKEPKIWSGYAHACAAFEQVARTTLQRNVNALCTRVRCGPYSRYLQQMTDTTNNF